MIYLIILARTGQMYQVEQLTDELLEAWEQGDLEVLQIPCASGARVMELTEADNDRLEWAGVCDYEG